MKSFAVLALVATTSAQKGFMCLNKDDSWFTDRISEDEGVTDDFSCLMMGLWYMEITAEYINKDSINYNWCINSMVQGAVAANGAADKIEPYVNCQVFWKATTAYDDIRHSAPEMNGLVYSAWAWSAGEPLEDAKAADESEYDSGLGWNDFFADSANMMTSYLAAIATIAMVAY